MAAGFPVGRAGYLSAMTTNDSNTPNESTPNTDGEAWTDAKADRAPTADETKAADEAAKHVDVDKVAKHAEEMMEIGAEIKGEGEIETKTS